MGFQKQRSVSFSDDELSPTHSHSESFTFQHRPPSPHPHAKQSHQDIRTEQPKKPQTAVSTPSPVLPKKVSEYEKEKCK